jgi:NADH-quinone oxidoreductase subunit G
VSAVSEQGVEMVSIEVNGMPLEVPRNSMIIEATDKAGISVPRFCYHDKLSIAANCRMCLVDVEKAPKPLPACATPVMDGMKVYTHSRRAIDAQHGVMEFLLINHPLDCPICDQGGECELQDLAMGYGRSVSRFTERKRVVKDKNVGPLVQTDMTRCIHCTRCVRFLEEIAGTSEMGGSGRGDRLEIGTCIETSIDSELSGNIIDLCPVGALTNKPFRFSARAWELVAKPSVAVHDGLGSSLWYHTRRGSIMRAAPRRDESVNETWLSDRDRYSHFGLYAGDRVLNPMARRDGEWAEVSWEEALSLVGETLKSNQGDRLGMLISPNATNEAGFLARRLAEGLGCGNLDHRLRESDFGDDGARPARFEVPIAEVQQADAVFLVGSNVRHEAPLLGHRLREAWRNGASITALNPLDWNFHFDLDAALLTPPQNMVAELARVAAAVAEISGTAIPAALALPDLSPPGEDHRVVARSLLESESGLVLLGQFAMAHQDAAWLRQLSAWVARTADCGLNLLPHGGNSTGAALTGVLPTDNGRNAREMLEQALDAYLLWDFEPALDTANPAMTMRALEQADQVIAVASFAGEDLKSVADVILPLAPLVESEGSVVNLDGRVMTVTPAGRVSGQARPGWKILRALGETMGLDGFEQVSLDELQAEMRPALAAGQERGEVQLAPPGAAGELHRIGEVPMYSVDGLCRRSEPLQNTVQAQNDFVGLSPADAGQLGIKDGDTASVSQDGDIVELQARIRDEVPVGGAWIRSATAKTAVLGDATGPVSVKPAKAEGG